MNRILCLESSTEVCSVAIIENGEILDFREENEGLSHSKMLTVFIQDILKSNDLQVADIDAVAVSEGPGSYTGLRIGVSVAKGICYAGEKPLIAISSLEAMTHYVLKNSNLYNFDITHNDILVPMIDARRMEVYRAIYNSKAERVQKVEAVIVDEKTFETELKSGKVIYYGNGAEKCKTVLQHPNAVFIDSVITSSKSMAVIATQKFESGEFVDVAYFEPFYLKNFIAIKSKKNILEKKGSH